MKKILVVGGSGFLGQHLIERLIEAGENVKSLDITRPKLAHRQFEFTEGSYTDPQIVAEALSDCSMLFHLASTTLPKTSNEDPVFDIRTNLEGSVTLLDSAVKAKIKKFIFISSGGTIYGVPKQLPVQEEHPTNPICSYGIVKLAIEKYLQLYHKFYGLETCSLRLSNPYGEYQRSDTGQGAVSTFCHKALSGSPIEIWGDGSVIRDYIYIKDAIDAMLRTIHCDCAGMAINIGYGKGVSLNRLIKQIEAGCGKRIECRYLSARAFDVPEIYLDIRRAKEVLGWEPEVSLSEGIALLIAAKAD